jgi:hypothetical protein
MLYGSCQYFLKINPLYFGGGTITPTIVSSELSSNNRPPTISYTPFGAAGPRLQMPANLPATPSTTDTIKWLNPGTHIVKVRLTNTVPFNQAEDIRLRWNLCKWSLNKNYCITDSNNTHFISLIPQVMANPIPTISDQ